MSLPPEYNTCTKHTWMVTNVHQRYRHAICRGKRGATKMKKAIAVFVSIALAGCATASKDIAGVYVSPVAYQNYDCQQLVAETARIQGKVNQIGGRLDEAASNDKAIAGVGVILFWPALFALGGTKAQETEYASLKGQADAVQQAAIDRKCVAAPLPVTDPAPAPIVAAPAPSV